MVAVHSEAFDGYPDSVVRALEAIGAPDVLARQKRVLIKPNLVNDAPPPVTLPVAAAEALVRAVRRWSRAEVLIGEGPGDLHLTAAEAFRIHGYVELAQRCGVALVDLNEAPLERLAAPGREVFPEFWLPRLLRHSFVISAAVLKAHSLAGVTLTMKNMMGCAPPAHYRRGGAWNKAGFHAHMQRAVFELNCYRKPDLAFVDASVGLAEYHLGGRHCDPAPGVLLAGFDPVAVDAAGAALLGRDWRGVGHIRLADGVLGSAGAEGRAAAG